MTNKIFISCGELSGEIHANNLIKELKLCDKEIIIKAFASNLIENEGIELFENYNEYSFSGLTEVISNLRKILRLKDNLAKKIIEFNPDLVVLVDYGGFHIELAKKLKKLNYQGKVIQFIAPQIWASRPWRIKNIKKYIDKVFCTLPFEEKLYKKNNIPVEYVGNPVFSSLSPRSFKKDLDIDQKKTLIGIFPGSRISEVKYMLPIMIRSAQKLKEVFPNREFEFLLARAPTISIETLNRYGFDQQSDIKLLNTNLNNPNHALLSAANCLWLCSGTVTLEAAFYAVPYFLAYKSTKLNYFLYKVLRTIKKARLANIISGTNLVKEFLQDDASVDNFVNETASWFEEDGYSNYYHLMQKALLDFSENFAKYPSYKIANDLIMNELPEKNEVNIYK